MLPAEGLLEIITEYEIGADGIPRTLHVSEHDETGTSDGRSDAIGADTTMKYNEAHFHSPHGGIEARPRAQVTVDEGGQSVTTFNLMHGRAGALEFDYTVDVAAHGVVELTTKAYGIERDAITVRELIRLNSEGARSVTKTRATLRDDATSQMFTTTEAGAPNARGHMDCTETVRGHAITRNIPRKYPRSKSLRASRWLGVVG